MVVPKEFHEIWKPFNKPFEEVKKDLTREFIVDEYCISTNIHDNNFKYSGIIVEGTHGKYFVHLNVNTDSLNIQDEIKKIKSFLK